ncbi:sulfurtransferase [Ramlibacter monticola]|uniref:Sulfurtransferase n=1 Tax=Ramlibacter monticola TaxID=1926872 RepID=A0A937CUC0_9BURK|nr:rhodanese-like domain-containing protein [Ramlibacter monticola]MBL0392538.1 sulfurtransferase [Ramlibacter monticola]
MLPRRVPRWQQLVTPEWLAALLAGEAVDAAPSIDWRLFEVSSDFGQQAAQGHIPGAGYLDTHQLESGPLWNKVPDAALLRVLLEHGIRFDTPVLLYSRNPLCAARAAHLMLYAGVQDVRLLDGGFAAWLRSGRQVTTGAPRRYPAAESFGSRFPARPDYLVGMDQVRGLVHRDDGVLVSIRSWGEFTGQTSGYSYICARGEIPGARWGRAGHDGDVQSMSDFHHPDGTMKSAAEIQAFWKAAGIHPAKHATFYCGTGWRASLAFFYAWVMNWERISVYDGGWLEWSSHPGNAAA